MAEIAMAWPLGREALEELQPCTVGRTETQL